MGLNSFLLLFVERERMEFLEIAEVWVEFLEALGHVKDLGCTLYHLAVIDLHQLLQLLDLQNVRKRRWKTVPSSREDTRF